VESISRKYLVRTDEWLGRFKTWPIFATGILALVARVRGVVLILNIQDLYPESLIAQKRISQNGVISHGLRNIDRWIAKISSAVVVPAPSFARVYQRTRGLPPEKLYFVPNWFDNMSVVVNDIKGAEFRKKLGIPFNAQMVLYGGNVGAAAGVETVIESFRYLRDIENLYLAIAGDGTNLKSCQHMAVDMDHPRIRFYSPWPVTETSQALSAADILVLPTRGQQSLASIPSKLIAYMLAARPVLALSLPESDLAQIVRKSGCGWVVAPDQPRLLSDVLKQILYQSKNTLGSRGLAGRSYALSNFSGDACLPKFAAIIKKAVSE
jgi:colanic acid biosynthesis glycosyl transferase WcaI